MRYLLLLLIVCASVGCRREAAQVPIMLVEEKTMETPVAPVAGGPGTLTARVVSWDVGFHPATEAEWVDRVVAEVRAANAAKIDVLVFPELFATGLSAYGPQERWCEFVTRRMNEVIFPRVKETAGPTMLVCLGTYAHQEPGWTHALNRSPVLLDGVWHFVDKIHPTQRERVDDPPIKPGEILPVFTFRGGNVAVAVCFTLEMPEVSAALKKQGVQLVLGPTATEDEDGVARILRASSARAVELGAAVVVAPLIGQFDDWKNIGSAALYLPAQKGIIHRPQESVRRASGIAHDDFVIPWQALLDLRTQPAGKPETRPFLAEHPFRIERK